MAQNNEKIKVVHVLSDEEVEGFEHGFINAKLIAKYAPKEDYSVFVCGPKAMIAFAPTWFQMAGELYYARAHSTILQQKPASLLNPFPLS